MSAEEKAKLLEEITEMAEEQKAFITGLVAGISLTKKKEEAKEA